MKKLLKANDRHIFAQFIYYLHVVQQSEMLNKIGQYSHVAPKHAPWLCDKIISLTRLLLTCPTTNLSI